MSDNVISVENLGKRYTLRHKGSEPYTTLRDVIARQAVAPFKSIAEKLRGARGGPNPAGPQDSNSAPNESVEHFWALKDVSFDVKHGDVLGVIGRNGAGKSTLLKILSRITEPTRGRVRIKGRVASLLEVGTGFHPELTGRENVYLNGAILGMSRAETRAKFDEIVAFAEVEKFLDTPVKRYSSGMYVRLAFAVAAHLEPETLIVDEVLAVGDAEFQRKCLGKMQTVSRQDGRTVLFVSHNTAAVRSLCTKTMMLRGGRLLEIGETEKIVDRYLTVALDSTCGVMDVDAASRSIDMGSRLRITQVVFNKGKDIRHGEPLWIDIHFKALASEEDVSFGIGFCNRDGTKIFSIDTDIPGERLKIGSDRHGVVSIKIPLLHMEPDFYLIDVGARSGDNFGLDYIPGCGSIVVIPGESTPPVIAMRESGRGGFRQPSEWTIQYQS